VSTLEDKLRDAYQDAAQTVRSQAIRPAVPLPPASSPLRRRGLRMLAPIAAAAAVLVVIAGVFAVPHLLPGPTDNGSAAAPAGPASWIPKPQATSGTPPFLVVLEPTLKVVAAASGKVTATVPVPVADYRWTALAAAGTSRTFVLVASPSGPSCNSGQWSVFYTLTLSASGRPTGLTPLAIPSSAPKSTQAGSTWGTALAVSADGSTLAYVATPCDAGYNTDSTDTIVVVRHGSVRTWTEPWALGPTSLTLSSNGSTLGYVNLTMSSPATAGGSAWVLPTDAAPGVATQRGHRVFADGPAKAAQAQSGVLSPDGSTMYILMAIRGWAMGEYGQDQLDAYDTATGKLTRTLHTWGHINTSPPVITAGGDQALIWQMENNYIVQINLGTAATSPFTQLPATNRIPLLGLAWLDAFLAGGERGGRRCAGPGRCGAWGRRRWTCGALSPRARLSPGRRRTGPG